MSYQAPRLSLAGLSIPAFADILAYAIAAYQGIEGQNIYLGNDTTDYQLLSLFALFTSDTMQGVQLMYNSRGPSTATGTALDAIVKMNGLIRLPASYSTCYLVVTGAANAVINNGVARDINGYSWSLPATVTIPAGGTITVQATAQQAGPINANPGDISIIATGTAGWTSVTNTAQAVAGAPIESDAALRARQAISVALPSKTRLAGTIAGIAQTLGVTRYNVVENPTAAVDANGNPPHSVAAVVEGGADLDVATAIFRNRGIGCFTNGTTALQIADPSTGILTLIRFFRPTYVPVFVTITVHGLTGYSSAVTTQIQNDIVTYLSSLQIGEEIVWSELFGAALNARPNPDAPLFSIRSLFSGTAAGPSATADIAMAFNQVASATAANVVVNLV